MSYSENFTLANENEQQRLARALLKNKESFSKNMNFNCSREYNGFYDVYLNEIFFTTTRKTDISRINSLIKKLNIKLAK